MRHPRAAWRLFLAAAVATVVLAVASEGPSALAQAEALKPVPGRAAVRRGDIFVPKPRGADDTLDDSTGKGGSGDKVSTIHGDQVVGKVAAIDTQGRLHLTGPHFIGEVLVRASALQTIEFVATAKGTGTDHVVLANGDYIVGNVAAITPDAVLIESMDAGPLEVSRKVVQAVAFTKAKAVLVESFFHQGRMAPWISRTGSWKIQSGALQTSTHGGYQTICAKADQNEAVTMEVKVESSGGPYLYCDLVLFADNNNGQYGTNSIYARFNSSRCYLQYAQNGSTRSILSQNIGRTLRTATLRLAYDPDSGIAKVWVDAQLLGERAVPSRPKSGKYVMFNSRYSCRVKSIRVASGIIGPAAKKSTGETAADLVTFINKDSVRVESVTASDGKLHLKTPFGPLEPPMEKIRSIVFRSKGLEKPRRQKGDIRVETPSSRFTLQFVELTAKHLIGKSAYLGQVKVQRSSLKKVRFNIYPKDK